MTAPMWPVPDRHNADLIDDEIWNNELVAPLNNLNSRTVALENLTSNATYGNSALNDRLIIVENGLDSTNSDVSAIESTLSTAVSDISSLNGRVTTLEGEMDTAQSDILDLQAITEDGTSGNLALSNRLGAGVGTGSDPNTGSATSQLDALRSRVGALESVTPGGITAYSATLPTLSDPASSNYVDWGTAIQIPNPGYEVIVMAWLSGFVLNDGQGTQNRLRVSATLDGSTWVNGAPAVDQAGGGASTRRGGMTSIYMTRGVPTTDISVKGQAYWSGSGGAPSFYEGYLTVLVIPAGE
jgi:hypothetical protein